MRYIIWVVSRFYFTKEEDKFVKLNKGKCFFQLQWPATNTFYFVLQTGFFFFFLPCICYSIKMIDDWSISRRKCREAWELRNAQIEVAWLLAVMATPFAGNWAKIKARIAWKLQNQGERILLRGNNAPLFAWEFPDLEKKKHLT